MKKNKYKLIISLLLAICLILPLSVMSAGIANFRIIINESGGGGGGGGGGFFTGDIYVSGWAYPSARVYVLRDGVIFRELLATANGDFGANLGSFTAGAYNLGFYAIDAMGRQSAIVSAATQVLSGATVQISDVFIPPTIYLNKTIAAQNSMVAISGMAYPGSTVTLTIRNSSGITVKQVATVAGATGYLSNVLLDLPLGAYTVSAVAKYRDRQSGQSRIMALTVGLTDEDIKNLQCDRRADLNCDGRVNIVDFSIAAYWWGHSFSDVFRETESRRLNGDGKINLIDFSIMAYYWTG